MSRLTWNAPERRFFDTGLDRGVLYPKQTPPIGPVLHTNLVPNPVFGNGTVGWIDSTVGDFTTATEGSVTVGVYEHTSAGADPDRVSTSNITTKPGEVLRGSIDLKLQVAQATQVSMYRLYLLFYNNGTFLSSAASAGVPINSLSGTAFTTLQVSGTAPANANQVRLQVQPTYNASYTALPNGAGFRIKNPILFVGDKFIPFFSGATPDTEVTSYEWAGTPHASVSYFRPKLTMATSWDGLTSVEENGGESARAYYVDGRPFLFMPVPKEFSATLNAYTYPDAFSDVMGLAEIADGMYLDSQIGTAFDLSYRTKVGNAAEGQDHGYKIHLVYNATVTPGNLTYETLSDSVNPTTMSWAIQAVPVKVEGYRPTAHIVIDTRHMTQSKIDAIEDLLYGSSDNLANMPTPQKVFDVLNYGDLIVVIDNGDGTFTVEGAYENVYMISDGEFRIDNIDGQYNGDGTFTISTTVL